MSELPPTPCAPLTARGWLQQRHVADGHVAKVGALPVGQAATDACQWRVGWRRWGSDVPGLRGVVALHAPARAGQWWVRGARARQAVRTWRKWRRSRPRWIWPTQRSEPTQHGRVTCEGQHGRVTCEGHPPALTHSLPVWFCRLHPAKAATWIVGNRWVGG